MNRPIPGWTRTLWMLPLLALLPTSLLSARCKGVNPSSDGLLALLPTSLLSAEPPSVLLGEVLDPSGSPVAGARAVLENARQAVIGATESDSNGRFSLQAGRAGGYLLHVSKENVGERRVAVDLDPAQPLRISLRLALYPQRSEITVTAVAGGVQQSSVLAQRVNVLDAAALREKMAVSLTGALEQEEGAAAQRTSSSMGGIFIRGLTGSNVAVYKDGVRYTTSAQRGGVSTFLNLNEPGHLDRVEILRGPGSGLYGSDSMGGTLHLISRSAAPVSSGWHGELSTLLDSASWTWGAAPVLSYARGRTGFLLSLAGRRASTLRSGGGLDSHAAVTRFLGLPSTIAGRRLPDTAFTQYGGMFRGHILASAAAQLTLHYERNQQDGGKRYDQLLGGDGNLIADLRNLMLDFAYLRYQHFGLLGFEETAAGLSYNAQREERVNQGGQGNPLAAITHQYERTRAWGTQFHLSRPLAGHRILFGGDAYQERVTSPAFSTNPATGAATRVRPRIPNGARYLLYGLYGQHSWEPLRDGMLRLSATLRFNGASYRSRAAFSPLVNGMPLFPDDSLALRNLSGSFGAAFSPAPPWRLFGRYSRGFRAPNLTDLGGVGLQGNGFYEASAADLGGWDAEAGDRADELARPAGIKPRPLGPEFSDNVEGGMVFRQGRLRLESTFFSLLLRDAIVSRTLLLAPGAVGRRLGEQVITRQLPGGAVFVPLATNPVLVKVNAGSTRILGFEQSALTPISTSWSVRQSFTWLQAEDVATGAPPDLEGGIPAPALHAALRYSPPSGRFWLDLHGTAAHRQHRLSSLALADRRIGASRSRQSIANFFHRGARARGWVDENDRLLPTGETLDQVQRRVLGDRNSAPLFRAIPGYALFGLRCGFRAGERSDLMLEASNLLDRNYRGLGWGIDGAGRSFMLRYRRHF